MSQRGLRPRHDGQVAVLTAYVSPALAMSAKVRAAVEKRTLSALVAEALEEHLGAA